MKNMIHSIKKVGQTINNAKTKVIVLTMVASSEVMANQAQHSAQQLTGTLQAFLSLMPVASKIAGIIAMIGGLWSLYKYYKSQGRDGSIAAGIAGLGVGAGLFFLGGLLTFTADSLGIEQNSQLPTN
jgi:hypothetical protein